MLRREKNERKSAVYITVNEHFELVFDKRLLAKPEREVRSQNTRSAATAVYLAEQRGGGFKGEGYIPNEFRVTARRPGGETDERRYTMRRAPADNKAVT